MHRQSAAHDLHIFLEARVILVSRNRPLRKTLGTTHQVDAGILSHTSICNEMNVATSIADRAWIRKATVNKIDFLLPRGED